MGRKLIFSLLIVAIVALPLLTGCDGDETTPTPATQPTATAATPATTANANWWDKFGEPQYGGTLTVRMAALDENWDPAKFGGYNKAHWECLFYRDWTVDRDICGFKTELVPADYYGGGLAESWEQTDPLTYIIHLHEGVKWQNKAPLNGRELVAADVEYTYDRILGTGSGFTDPNPFLAGSLTNIEKVVAVDDYTLEFRMKNPAAIAVYDVFDGGFFPTIIVAPELVEQGLLDDWHYAVGTGPYMISEFVSGSKAEYVRNPDYWGYDQRYPENQLPYADVLTEVMISDIPTALAAMKSGQIDVLEAMNVVNYLQAQSLIEANPNIQMGTWPTPGYALEMRLDREPFTDIRVRKALQLALPLEIIAQSHYGGSVPGKPEGLINPENFGDWTTPYDEWPAELQAEYGYDPEKAMQLLAEAGYPNGFETDIIANTGQNIELLEIVKAYFMEIGVDMEIQIFPDMASKQSYAAAKKMDQMTYSATTGHSRAPFTIIKLRTPGNMENYAQVDDAEYTALVDGCLTASTLEEAQQYAREADLHALQQHWAVNVFSTVSPVFWQSWVKGNSGEQLVAGYYYYYSRWWIDQDAKK